MKNQTETSVLILPWESYMSAALRHWKAWNFESAQKVADLQENIAKKYVWVFLSTAVDIQQLAKNRINGIGLIRDSNEDTIPIIAAFYSATWPHELAWTFWAMSFLQNMTQFKGATILYEKDPSIRPRLKNALLSRYIWSFINEDIVDSFIDGQRSLMIDLYPDPNPELGWDSWSRKKELLTLYENLLFQEMKTYIFPHLKKP